MPTENLTLTEKLLNSESIKDGVLVIDNQVPLDLNSYFGIMLSLEGRTEHAQDLKRKIPAILEVQGKGLMRDGKYNTISSFANLLWVYFLDQTGDKSKAQEVYANVQNHLAASSWSSSYSAKGGQQFQELWSTMEAIATKANLDQSLLVGDHLIIDPYYAKKRYESGQIKPRKTEPSKIWIQVLGEEKAREQQAKRDKEFDDFFICSPNYGNSEPYLEPNLLSSLLAARFGKQNVSAKILSNLANLPWIKMEDGTLKQHVELLWQSPRKIAYNIHDKLQKGELSFTLKEVQTYLKSESSTIAMIEEKI